MIARFSLTVGFLAALGASALAEVTILGQPGSFTTIQAAVDAAMEGDVLIVEDGNYGLFTIDGKGLTVMARNAGQVSVKGPCSVRNLPAAGKVAFVGLDIQGASPFCCLVPNGLDLIDNAGQIRLQDCDIRGGFYYNPFGFSGHGLVAMNSAQVVIAKCVLRGADGGIPSGEDPIHGGDGIHATNSALAIHDSFIYGGWGSIESYPTGGDGGDGCRIQGWGMFASGTRFSGGWGGSGDFIGCTSGGDGGDGLAVTNAQAQLLDNVYFAGPAGIGFGCGNGLPGQAIANNGAIINQYSGTARKLTGPDHTPETSPVSLTLSGETGDDVWLLSSFSPGFGFLKPLNGVITLQGPWVFPVRQLGTIGSSGTINVPLRFHGLSGSSPSRTFYYQGLCRSAGGSWYLTTPHQIVVIDA